MHNVRDNLANMNEHCGAFTCLVPDGQVEKPAANLERRSSWSRLPGPHLDMNIESARVSPSPREPFWSHLKWRIS